MGKFNELDIELKEYTNERRKTINMLVVQYPFMQFFIQQAFDLGDEDKVFDLIFTLELEYLPC